jgi:hypothetical protein
MPIGKLSSKGLGQLGGGLSIVQPGHPGLPPPPPRIIGDLVLTDSLGIEDGFIFTENLETISVTAL